MHERLIFFPMVKTWSVEEEDDDTDDTSFNLESKGGEDELVV